MPQKWSETRRSDSTSLFLASFFAFACLGGLSLWVSRHGYADPAAADSLRRAHAMAVGPETILRQVSSTYPPVPLLLQAVASLIPGFRAHLPVNLLPAICASLLLGWLYLELCRVVSPFRAVFWTLLAAAHPFFLWAATSSLAAIIALWGFLVLAKAVLRIARWADARSFLTFTFVLAVSIADWDGALVLFLFLLLAFPVFLPSEIRRSSVSGGYVSAFLMPFSAIACSLYTDWVFGKAGMLFSTLRESTILPNPSAFAHRDQAWLFVIFVPLLSAPLALSPLFSFLHLRAIEKRAVLMCISIPSVLLFTGVAWRIPAHRTETLSLCAILPAAILLGFLREYKNVPALCTSLLLAGVLAGWATFMMLPLPEMQTWLDALRANGSVSLLGDSASLLPWLLAASGLFAAALGTAVLRQP